MTRTRLKPSLACAASGGRVRSGAGRPARPGARTRTCLPVAAPVRRRPLLRLQLQPRMQMQMLLPLLLLAALVGPCGLGWAASWPAGERPTSGAPWSQLQPSATTTTHQLQHPKSATHPVHPLHPMRPRNQRQAGDEAEQLRRAHLARGALVVRKRRAQALELAVSRLHILESLDEQLREFAGPPADRRQHQRPHRPPLPSGPRAPHTGLCRLPLEFAESAGSAAVEGAGGPRANSSGARLTSATSQPGASAWPAPANCLAHAPLAAQVPPFMANLRRQLLGEARSLAEAGRLMPYGARVVRSLHQAGLERALTLGEQKEEQEEKEEHDDDDEEALQGFAARGAWPAPQPPGARQQPRGPLQAPQPLRALQNLQTSQPPLAVELSALASAACRRAPASERPPAPLRAPVCAARAPGQPLLTSAGAGPRELCYYFALGAHLEARLAPSQARDCAPERLVEAELHVYKLRLAAPPANRTTGDWAAARGQQSQPQPQRQPSSNQYRNLYHLRTNLVEVSLYQILPGKLAPSGQLPLRLLDIRRIDLEASGWETFYAKRAVADWLADASSNLGLVIKAKSMFGEPIRLGLIQFAGSSYAGQPAEAARFSSSHQPILVVYSTSAASPPSTSVAAAQQAASTG